MITAAIIFIAAAIASLIAKVPGKPKPKPMARRRRRRTDHFYV